MDSSVGADVKIVEGCSKRRPSHPPNPGAPRRAFSQARPQRV